MDQPGSIHDLTAAGTHGVNQSLARARALGERANATVKCWKVLTKLRCCPQRATPVLAAVTALQHAEADRRCSR